MKSLDFCLLVGQQKQLKDVILEIEHWALFTFLGTWQNMFTSNCEHDQINEQWNQMFVWVNNI